MLRRSTEEASNSNDPGLHEVLLLNVNVRAKIRFSANSIFYLEYVPTSTGSKRSRKRSLLHYHANEEDVSSDETVVGESGDDGESYDTEDRINRNFDDDESLNADDLVSIEGNNDSNDDEEDMEPEIPPPLRERIGLNASQLKASSGRTWTTSPSGMAGRYASANICLDENFKNQE